MSKGSEFLPEVLGLIEKQAAHRGSPVVNEWQCATLSCKISDSDVKIFWLVFSVIDKFYTSKKWCIQHTFQTPAHFPVLLIGIHLHFQRLLVVIVLISILVHFRVIVPVIFIHTVNVLAYRLYIFINLSQTFFYQRRRKRKRQVHRRNSRN